ncbi:ATP-binding protein [Pseudoalteromonas piscicida]|uniref:sensor histidine kinase n=1 Tax=Pseudoalteromonas piscicida TaxID=43662 RepID=UPI001EFE17E9|nr:histidine kinase dimerization/phospho-acceptor domain-containing protein [Pseudoalteromonas piscicida]MCG9770143.1 ATP-binding protein [Pseudoalteromonas piscicida]
MLIKWLTSSREAKYTPLNYLQGVKKLRVLTSLITLLIMILMALLLYFSYQSARESQLDSYRQEARNLIQVTNTKLFRKLIAHDSIPATAFDYYSYSYNSQTNQTDKLRSPLVSPATQPNIPGLVGFFQINADHQFSSPIWIKEINFYAGMEQQINSTSPFEKKAFEILQLVSQSSRINALLGNSLNLKKQHWNITFDVPDNLLFYRIITNSKSAKIQGFLVERTLYLQRHINDILALRSFSDSVLVKLTDNEGNAGDEYFLYQKTETNEVIVSNPEQTNINLQQQIIDSSTLKWPYSNYDILISTKALPFSKNMFLGGAFLAVLFSALLIGCFGFYRLGLEQLQLAEQRLNFVSSVSHELKTPLTSIKMYSEMLQAGIVQSPTHQAEYYDFIHSESERLSRLIDNILQLTKLHHQKQTVKPQPVSVAVLMDIIHSKASSLMLKHNFKQHISTELVASEETMLNMDLDAFSQIIINITDNAIKFYDQAKINDIERQKVDFIFRRQSGQTNMLELEVRDYGAGITESQEKRIFELFYRAGNELTRATQGTGIGLALVHELVHAHRGEVLAVRRNPGLAINITFPIPPIH